MTEAESEETRPDLVPDETIDNRGRGCAAGIALVQQALSNLPDGAVLEVRSTDKRAKVEFPKLAERTRHELLAFETERVGLLKKEYTAYVEIHRE